MHDNYIANKNSPLKGLDDVNEKPAATSPSKVAPSAGTSVQPVSTYQEVNATPR